MDNHPPVNDTIPKPSVFNRLSTEQYDAVVKSGVPKPLAPKSVLFRQGDPAQKCFLVSRGRLKLVMLNEQGKEVIIRYVHAGELTAAVTVLRNRNYPVTAEAVEKSEVIGWDKPTLLGLMERIPHLALNMLNIVLERLDDVQQRYLELCTEQVEQRIARTLLRLMRRAGKKTPEGVRIDIPLSRQSVADYSGTTLYTVSRTLSSWEKSGWIRSGRELIVITDPHALVRFAETV